MKQSWGLLRLDEIDSVNTQSIWHAAALTRSAFDYDNILFIDWPNKPFVSVGFHQDPREEIDLPYCKEKGYTVYRRACGGGQVFLDGDQIFYHMITDPENEKLKGNMQLFYEELLKPVVKTYNDFGLSSKYAPINDIVSGSKKVSGNGAATLGESKILTGNFILSFPSHEMSKVLKVPDEKFRDKIAQSLDERVGSFKSILGSVPDRDTLIRGFIKNFEDILGVELHETTLPEETKRKMEELNEMYETDEWKFEIHNKTNGLRAVKIKGDFFVAEGMHKAEGGLLKCIVVSDQNRIKDMAVHGDIAVDPMDGLQKISMMLSGSELTKETLTSKVHEAFNQVDLPGVTVEEFVDMVFKIGTSHVES